MKNLFTSWLFAVLLASCKPSTPLPAHLQKLESERKNLFDGKIFISEDAFYYLQGDWDYSRSPIRYPLAITSILRGKLSLTWKTDIIVYDVDSIGYGHGFVFGKGLYKNDNDNKIYFIVKCIDGTRLILNDVDTYNIYMKLLNLNANDAKNTLILHQQFNADRTLPFPRETFGQNDEVPARNVIRILRDATSSDDIIAHALNLAMQFGIYDPTVTAEVPAASATKSSWGKIEIFFTADSNIHPYDKNLFDTLDKLPFRRVFYQDIKNPEKRKLFEAYQAKLEFMKHESVNVIINNSFLIEGVDKIDAILRNICLYNNPDGDKETVLALDKIGYECGFIFGEGYKDNNNENKIYFLNRRINEARLVVNDVDEYGTYMKLLNLNTNNAQDSLVFSFPRERSKTEDEVSVKNIIRILRNENIDDNTRAYALNLAMQFGIYDPVASGEESVISAPLSTLGKIEVFFTVDSDIIPLDKKLFDTLDKLPNRQVFYQNIRDPQKKKLFDTYKQNLKFESHEPVNVIINGSFLIKGIESVNAILRNPCLYAFTDGY